MSPFLPKGWNYMKLKNVKAFNRTFDIEVNRDGNSENIIIKLSDGQLVKKKWDRKTLLEIELP